MKTPVAMQRALDALQLQHGFKHPKVIHQQMELAEWTGGQGAPCLVVASLVGPTVV